jgi:protein SCO1/2
MLGDFRLINMKKIISLIAFYSLFTAALIAYFVFHPSPVRLKYGVYMNQPQAIAPFELIDNRGTLFTEKQLKNHWTLLFFGFSSCPMICPSALQTFNTAYENLPQIKRPQVILISVDPKRDSLQKLNQFIHQFNSDFIALRGELSAINSLQKQLHVPVSITPMSHGREILLINPQAQVQAYFYYPINAEALVLDLNHLIK